MPYQHLIRLTLFAFAAISRAAHGGREKRRYGGRSASGHIPNMEGAISLEQPYTRQRMLRTLVIIPALNEEAAIGSVIDGLSIAQPECDVLVIDDGSTDRTAATAAEHGARVVSLPFNMGVGTALRTGFRYAQRHGYDRVVQTDADGQHPPAGIEELLAALDAGADIAIGSRFAARDGHYSVERSRGLAMSLLRVMLRVILGRWVTDSTSGFRAFDRPVIEQFARTYPREFLSDTVEALIMASYHGFRIDEVAVTMRHRVAGEPSHRNVRLAFHYIRVLVVMVLTVSLRGARVSRKQLAQ